MCIIQLMVLLFISGAKCLNNSVAFADNVNIFVSMENCSVQSISYTEAIHSMLDFHDKENITMDWLKDWMKPLMAEHQKISINSVHCNSSLPQQSSEIQNSKHFLLKSSFISGICSNLLKIQKTFLSFKDTDRTTESEALPSKAAIWSYGLLSVTVISLCSLVGIGIMRLKKSAIYDKVTLYLITLAVGTLSCNAIFQLIPEGFGIDGNPMTIWQSAVIYGGFHLFYLTENLLERIFDTSHSHDDATHVNKTQTDLSNSEKSHNNQNLQSQVALIEPSTVTSDVIVNSVNDKDLDISRDKPTKKKQWWLIRNYKSIKTVAWLITVADGIHNFIDGLAIGASFSISLLQGLSTSLAIFCEEFPHELGDFAILVNAGMSWRQAAFYNFASACCCYLGLVVGIYAGHDVSAAQWIFALAGGVFLYISLTGMLPEARAHCCKKGLRESPWLCLFIKHFGLFSGFLIMFLLTFYKDKITLE